MSVGGQGRRLEGFWGAYRIRYVDPLTIAVDHSIGRIVIAIACDIGECGRWRFATAGDYAAFQSMLFNGNAAILRRLEQNERRQLVQLVADHFPSVPKLTFHSSAMSCWVAFASSNSMHITKNLSLFRNNSILCPGIRTTFMLALLPGVKTPVLGRTRNFSGDVVLICRQNQKVKWIIIFIDKFSVNWRLLLFTIYIYLVRNGIFHHIYYVNGREQFVARLLKCYCLAGWYFQHDCNRTEEKNPKKKILMRLSRRKWTRSHRIPDANPHCVPLTYHFHWQLCHWEWLVTRTSVNRVDLNWQSVPAERVRVADRVNTMSSEESALSFNLVIISRECDERANCRTCWLTHIHTHARARHTGKHAKR